MLIHASAEAHDAHPRVRAGSWCSSARPLRPADGPRRTRRGSADAHRLKRARPQAAQAPDCPRADAHPCPPAHARPPAAARQGRQVRQVRQVLSAGPWDWNQSGLTDLADLTLLTLCFRHPPGNFAKSGCRFFPAGPPNSAVKPVKSVKSAKVDSQSLSLEN